ncbi:hypothetical protein A2716_03370 [candidate division WWE3 bacterium RIFCSPHIGHO2_01_FULL_40_23]|uniref:Uncharacterized protein n=1 Tax=candidate division WWE3 bacterium RIFCSPLOWO2_01_FULL_41_18 TaxID=1802625 RepID=A0A1F4VD72_UNCKA|nr:MAG: hypothetical protein A2716_03370 [candidate division WWE3 bacterium RIFCSPHIGHO2_01_FULL_40_23]OGC54920.1 MAG: hypothetical protein A3A78_02980 [candidate division WWE3 bacterium RIFCSPLOWO2_01_FULL_41_18]
MAQHQDNRYHQIKRVLEIHHKKVIKDFSRKHAPLLKKTASKGVSLAGAAVIFSSLLAGAASSDISGTKQPIRSEKKEGSEDERKDINLILKSGNLLTVEKENEIANKLSKNFDLKLSSTLDGNRLNEVYGFIGAEQHLYRWPGDTLSNHDLQRAGIAPLKGAFGYFDNAEQEKYYVAVQLHELPDWNSKWSTLKPWYRYRKVFVYNPDNGKAVVAVIGDSGPSKFTGKTFGGSPEIMEYLQRVDGAQKGKVVILFIEDPDNKVALGPVITNDNLALTR